MKKILLAIALFCPLATWAQDIKPFDAKLGLWESTSSTEIGGMPAMPAMPAIPQDALDKMPPAQRAQVEAMMRGRGGSPQTTTSKFCIDKDSLRKAFYNSEKSCSTKLVSSTGTTQQIHVECTRGNTRSTGDLTMERVDAEHMKGTGVFKSVGDASTGGRSMDIKVSFSNKWVAADCGDVKPVGEISAK
jgi:hypothetical protein